MCGFVGVASMRDLPPATVETVRRATDLIRHRGPDDVGVDFHPRCVLGHRRLSIIDLHNGHQPMVSDDGRYRLVFNGEIYNFREIREDLEGRGERFRTDSDTEVLLVCLMREGLGCLERLNGMFSFVLHDTSDGTLLMARDRLGIKPLYYAEVDDRIWFGSELKAFLPVPEVSRAVDPEALDEYLTFRYVVAPRTLWRSVRKVPPGFAGEWRAGRLRLDCYWDIPLPDHSQRVDEEEARERLRELLSDATRSRLVADVPVGVMLSGGLDSSIITSLAVAHASGPMKTFAIASSGGGDWDERGYARLVAERLGTTHYEMEVDRSEYVTSLENFVWHIDDLVADPASVLLSHVSELARREVTVALSGEGCDELLAGYRYDLQLKSWRRQRVFDRVPAPIVRLARLFDVRSPRVQRYLQCYRSGAAFQSAVMRGFSGRGLTAQDRRRICSPLGASASMGRSLHELTHSVFDRVRDQDPVTACLYADSKTWLPDNLLTKADRMSMAHSLELRVPFLDHRLVEHLARLPMEMKLRRGRDGAWETKAILRDAFRDDVPREILDRPKQGFDLDWKSIMAGEGQALLADLVESDSMREFFEPDHVRALTQGVSEHDPHGCQAILSLILFGQWVRQFGESASIPA